MTKPYRSLMHAVTRAATLRRSNGLDIDNPAREFRDLPEQAPAHETERTPCPAPPSPEHNKNIVVARPHPGMSSIGSGRVRRSVPARLGRAAAGWVRRMLAGMLAARLVGDDGQPVTATGMLQANDPVGGRRVWQVDLVGTVPQVSSTPLVVGDLVFVSRDDLGEVQAIEAATGAIVWQFRLGARSFASPVTYLGPDGIQYVAFLISPPGPRVWPPPGAFDPNSTWHPRREAVTLYVFRLAGAAVPTPRP